MSKQEEYREALARYGSNPAYRRLGYAVGAAILTLQAWTLWSVPWHEANARYVAFFVVAYALTDFVNGLVHMAMDNSDRYSGPVGPLVAVFHKHHTTPRYTDRHPLFAYVTETQSKNWLVFYLAALAFAQHAGLVAGWSFTLACVGVLSSFAEVSHYLCHNSTSRVVRALQRARVLLDPVVHARHHEQDNVSYAFLNGMTDPLLDWIARHTCPGYKNRSDVHAS